MSSVPTQPSHDLSNEVNQKKLTVVSAILKTISDQPPAQKKSTP
jgi:hypothetical protein